jgi:hypothetical protein
MAEPGGRDDTIEELIDFVEPYIDPIIERINVDEFTTIEFIQALNMDPETAEVYAETLARWPERDPHLAKLVVHGQVIPQALRRSRLVEWAGYAYGEEDPFGVPAWWRKLAG